MTVLQGFCIHQAAGATCPLPQDRMNNVIQVGDTQPPSTAKMYKSSIAGHSLSMSVTHASSCAR